MVRVVRTAGFDPLGLIYLGIIFAVIFVPMLFARSPSSPGSDSGSEEDGGHGPRRRPWRPTGPTGGIPLPNAEQSATRVRDHRGMTLTSGRFRRGRRVHAPERRRDRTLV